MKLSTGVHSIYSTFIFIGLVLGMQACGGSSSPPADANPAGYYTGSADVKTPSSPATPYNIPDLQIMINGNRIMMMSDAKAVLYDGTFTVSGNTLTSTVSIYFNGNIQTGAAGTATLSATITAGSQLTGSFTGTELGNGSFVSTYSTLSDTDSDIDNVKDTAMNNRAWTTNPNEAEAGNTFEIEITPAEERIQLSISPGGLTFQNCSMNNDGTSSFHPIAGSSLFAVTINFITCDNTTDVQSVNSGIYTGFSQYKPDTPNKIAFAMTNGKYALTDDFDEN